MQMLYSVTQHTHFTKELFTFKSHVFLKQKRKFNFILAHQKRTAFPASVFTKIANAQWNYVHLSYTAFHLNMTENVESTRSNH
jgi:hypothetical protein